MSDLRAILSAARPDDAGLTQFLSQWLDGRGISIETAADIERNTDISDRQI